MGVAVMILFIAGGAVGAFDGRPQSASASQDGWTLTVSAPERTRGGLPLPVSIVVHHAGGFGKQPVRLLLSRAVLDQANFNQWYPNPSGEAGDGDRVQYDFDAPSGDVLEIHLDAAMQPFQPPVSLPLVVTLLAPDGPELSVVHDVRVLP
jgi:hypothetical protein